MKNLISIIVVCVAVVATTSPAADPAALDRAFADLARFDWGKDAGGQGTIDAALREAHKDTALRANLEKRLIAILPSEASRAAKDYACRCLARIGTAESIPALAPLLTNADLSHMARYALERIPDEQAGAALLEALAKAQGKPRAGIARSLGVRGSEKAVEPLAALLEDKDASIASAAAAALGDIGTHAAAERLLAWRTKASEALRPAADDACLRAAHHLLKQHEDEAACKVFVQFATARSVHERSAGLAGLAAARFRYLDLYLHKALESQEPALRNLAGRIIGEMSEPISPLMLGRLVSLPPEGQVAMLNAIGAKKDRGAREVVLSCVASADPRVRIAAIAAMGQIGRASDVDLLVKHAMEKSPEADAARKSLATLPDPRADEMLADCSKSVFPARVERLKALAARNSVAQADVVAALLNDASVDTRTAAMETLGVIGNENHAAALIRAIDSGSEGEQAGTALKAIAARVKEKALPTLLAAWRQGTPAARARLITVLATVGGPEALKTLQAAMGDGSPDVKNGSVRALSEWTTADAAPVLLGIAREPQTPAHRTLALRGYARLIGQGTLSEHEKLKALTGVMTLAASVQEKKIVIGALGEVVSVDGLKTLEPYIAEADLADEAGAAAVRIIAKMKSPDKKVIEPVLRQIQKGAKAPAVLDSAKKEMQKAGIK